MWRPRTLTAEEWIANPFSGQRYALMEQIAVSLFKKQWISKAKTGTGIGKPNGIYGEVYAIRRKRTLETHPDWSDGHRHSDALRVMMKAFLKDLLVAWREAEKGATVIKLSPRRRDLRKAARCDDLHLAPGSQPLALC